MGHLKIYKTNIYNRLVTAKLENVNTVEDEIHKKCSPKIAYIILAILNFKILDISKDTQFFGAAYCDTQDVFDEIVGKKISGNKADIKYHFAIGKKYTLISKILLEAYNECKKLQRKHFEKAYKLQQEIDKYKM